MTEKMYKYLHEIIAGRAHPNSGRDHTARMAYVSCLQMLEYAEAAISKRSRITTTANAPRIPNSRGR